MISPYSLWKFSRPHTIIGTSLSVLAIYLIALATTNSAISSSNLEQMLAVWLACLFGNVYIVGLNQLTDVEIDRINKPHLPLAAEEFSLKQGKLIIFLTGALAILIGALSGIWLLGVITISLMIGTVYSLPPIRLKQFPFLAALCILTVRGVIVNLGLFWHFTQKFQELELFNFNVEILTLFILLFTIAIAIFKDVPDQEGDQKYNIATFTLILGKSTVFNLSRGVITICYLGMVGAGIIGLNGINSTFFTVYHLILLGILWWRSIGVDLAQKNEITSFYQFIWKLFFLEYLLFPLACFI